MYVSDIVMHAHTSIYLCCEPANVAGTRYVLVIRWYVYTRTCNVVRTRNINDVWNQSYIQCRGTIYSLHCIIIQCTQSMVIVTW